VSGVLLRDTRLERRGLLFVDREGTPRDDKTRHLAGCAIALLSKGEVSFRCIDHFEQANSLEKQILHNLEQSC
jgi:hypothetical protein